MKLPIFVFLLVLHVACGVLLCLAQTTELDAKVLVDRAMRAQVAAKNDTSRFEYVQTQLEKDGTRTYRVIESDAGSVQRMVAFNDRKLTPSQLAHEEQWLDKLNSNPSIQQARKKEDDDEEARRQRIIVVLGEAFLYTVERIESDGGIVRLHFRPNPKFHATTREARVCAGLEGTMWIDPQKDRFVRADGMLMRGVDFGWGLFGHLDKGGHFEIEQTEVDPGVWRITNMDVTFKGSMLIFRSLNIRVREHSSEFRRIPDHLSLQDAVEISRHESTLKAPL